MKISIKKLIIANLATVGIAAAIPLSAMAAKPETDVGGTVTNSGSPVVGAHVSVTCDGHTKTDTTDSSGSYLVVFKQKNCPVGATVTASASKPKKGSGSNSGTVDGTQSKKLNIAIVNVALPELGLLTGFGAAVVGAGTIFAIRRRDLNGNGK